jgi:hypothetical protein
MSAGGNSMPVNNDAKARYMEELNVYPEVNYTKPGYSLQLEPILDNINGSDVYVVKVNTPAGTSGKSYYDVQTGLKVKEETSEEGGGGGTTEFSDYKDVNGIKIPSTEKLNQGMEINLTLTDAKVNSGLADTDFQ